ncbi:MAG: histidine kinase [Armatimonadota bacterium]|jgi:signal transduction histidine kinase
MRARLRNLGVAARLTGGFAIVCLLIVILDGIGISGLSRVQERYAEAVGQLSWAVKAMCARGDLLEEVKAQKNYVLRGEEQYLRLAQQHAEQVDLHLAQMAAAPMSPKESEVVQTLDRQVRDLREAFSRATALRREGDVAGAVAAADAVMRGKAAAAVATLEVSVAAAEGRATDVAQSARSASDRTQRRTTVLVVAVGAFAILLGVALSLSITRPIAGLRRAVEAVAEGEMPADARPAFFHDELTSVSNAFHDLVRRASLLREMEARSKRVEALSARVVEAQEEERGRIARELHDGLGQALTAVKLDLSAAAAVAGDRGGIVGDRLHSAQRLTAETLEQVRRLARDLRPPALDDLGLVPALRSSARHYSDALPAEVTVEERNMEGRLPPRVETALYRIAQEALTNIARHADASHVRIELTREEPMVTLLVRDDGRGMDLRALSEEAAPGAGLGLLSMAHRAQELGGDCQVQSAPGEGTTIQVQIPIGEE